MTSFPRLKNAAGLFKEMLERDAQKVRPQDVEKVEEDVPKKLKRVSAGAIERESGMLGELLYRVRTLYTMIFDREYKVESKTKMMAVAALLYFLMPIDFVPDFIPGIGLIDDALVLRTLWSILSKEINRYTSTVKKQVSTSSSPNSLSAS